ncbi:MAG: 23S rRNA (adenine(2503)-C(2))-methyltransferase RlmN, partial [Spirochaetaceae bacterium]|nr:23S rRNA (adenine(2503)-C(2))-methyltransferase RlmN [Spirochaetaceae bacterium]
MKNLKPEGALLRKEEKEEPEAPDTKPVISGLTLPALQELLRPLPTYRARQVFQWIARGTPSFRLMTDLPAPLRETLDSRFSIRSSSTGERLDGSDGTVKLGITLRDGNRIEAVILSDAKERRTACLSVQAGCAMACVFCKTGRLGFSRNLTSEEMVEQFLHLRSVRETVSHIVFMGMGEPLLNLGELRKAVDVLTDPEGLGLSKRHITLSTSGIAEGIRDLAENGPDVRLAVSLTTACGALRARLMPAAGARPLAALKDALLYYQSRRERRVTLEAVLLGGINTREQDMDALKR